MTSKLIFVLILLATFVIMQAGNLHASGSASHNIVALASTVLHVPQDYSSIQGAINAASHGDIVYVDNGTYYENVILNKTIALVGKDPETTIIDGSTADSSTVWVYGTDVRDVTVRNFTIRGSTNTWGLYLFGTPNTTVENNFISNNHGGLLADASNNSTFVNNTITGNIYEGLLFFESSGNTMRNNTIYGNPYNFGIEQSAFDNDIDNSNLVEGKHVYILRNQTGITIDPNAYTDIGYLALINCSALTIKNLNLTSNISGIVLAQTNKTILTNNTFTSNAIGISIQDSTNNTLEGNSIANNWQGITLANSPSNAFKQNNLTANQEHIVISGSELSHFLQDMDTSNTVDAKLVRYVTNQTDLTITSNTFPNTGYLAVVNCQNVNIQNLTSQDNIMLIAFSHNSTISQNTITNGGISLQNVSFSNVFANRLTSGGDSGISISSSYNNTVTMNNVTQNTNCGIILGSSTDNLIIGNNIAENRIGMELDASTGNTIVGNNITANRNYGIFLGTSSRNMIYHNNFINNAVPGWQAVCGNVPSLTSNTWDNGYPSGGNYWNDYDWTDQKSGTGLNATGPDAIGDRPYDINFGQYDRYPLMGIYNDFAITPGNYHLEVISNSSIINFGLAVWLSSPTQYLQPGQWFILFTASGNIGTAGFCRVTIPRNLFNGTYTVLVDGQQVPTTELAESNSTHAYVYFTYQHSTHEIIIIPEYSPTALLISTIMVMVSLATAKAKKRLTLNARKD